MVTRIWHGWTTTQNALEYETLLKTEIFITIKNRNIKGFRGIELMKRSLNLETEFITIMRFDNLEAVKEFAGEEYEKSVVPAKAQALLKRYDAAAQHYQLII